MLFQDSETHDYMVKHLSSIIPIFSLKNVQTMYLLNYANFNFNFIDPNNHIMIS